MCDPRVGANFVFSPAGISACRIVHFEKDEIGKAVLAQAPGGAQTRDSAADNDHLRFLDALRSGKTCSVTQEMSGLIGFIDERSCDTPLTFERKANQRGTG